MLDNFDTKKSKAELIAELQALRGELAQTARDDMFQAILDNIPLRLTLKDSEGRYVYVNKAMTDAMSMTVEDFIGKTATEAYGDGRGVELDDYVIQVLQTGKAVRGLERPGQINTNLIYRRDIVPIEIRDGEATHILTISMDVSDRRRDQERLASAVETLSGPFSLWDADER
ncbi:MAG: PAS domain-containing protein, partial [Rhodospirillaceae bacterium]|nr:PAS domain-containing protein [Rhodospirillaceae bacterium]